jgi:hypothetical protein
LTCTISPESGGLEPGLPPVSKGAAAGKAGHAETATAALAEAKRLQPELFADWVEKHHPLVRPEDRAIYIEGRRKAGLG